MSIQQKSEVGILKILNHPHIVKLLDFYENDEMIVIIEELCDSNLLQVLEEVKQLSEQETFSIIKQLLSAIAHCHEKNIIHRYSLIFLFNTLF